MRTNKNYDHEAVSIIENTLFVCIMEWLSWEFTYDSSPLLRRLGLKLAKFILKVAKLFNLHIRLIYFLINKMTGKDVTSEVSLKDMKHFPAFLPEYQHYKFQLHGEGHTHIPLEEEPNIKPGRPTTYVNFGTWRDQILVRKNRGYRRRSVLRVFYIFDLKGKGKCTDEEQRIYKYFTDDIINWSDKNDALS